MKLCCIGWFLTVAAAVAASETPLPGWGDGGNTEQEVADWVAGETLLTGDEQPAEEPGLALVEPAAGEITGEEAAETVIPEYYWPEYFGKRPEKYLVDPQNLLGPADYRERLAFLNYHAGDSAIDLFVYVIGGDQAIPGEVRQEEMMERLFPTGRPAVVVLYFMGAPQRAMMHLSPSLADVVPPPEQRKALESSVIHALKEIEPARQIETFLVQMSIRIYWMERMMGGDTKVKEPVAAVVPVVKIPEKPGLREFLRPHLEEATRHVVPASSVAAAVLLGFATWLWLKRRARHHFPDFEVEPRLGGAHAAGVGAVISFASATVPPASQRDAMPDYLRRA
jgi:hypothetical protein